MQHCIEYFKSDFLKLKVKINKYWTFLNNKFFNAEGYQRIQKYMHVGRGQKAVVMRNFHGRPKFPKRWLRKNK